MLQPGFEEVANDLTSLAAAQLAARWCDFLEQHARKIYAAELNPEITAAHLLDAKIKAGAITQGMCVREVYRRQWSGLTKTETVWAGLHVLKAHNVIRILEQGTGGQMTEIIELNPGLKRSIAT